MSIFTTESLGKTLEQQCADMFSVKPESATPDQLYAALAIIFRDHFAQLHRSHIAKAYGSGAKQIHYLSMEFLVGRSLKNNLYNLGIEKQAAEVIEAVGFSLEDLYDLEPDAGLGNGGLGRLASCYMDALATKNYSSFGYCILYEFGIFKQRIIDGWQQENIDNWMVIGGTQLHSRRDERVEVRFGGQIDQIWEDEQLYIKHSNYESVMAVPYDMYIPGYNSDAPSRLRLWKSVSVGIDMERFNSGDYAGATHNEGIAELISKVLYPNDNHLEGKMLRLRQQYFLCSASLSDIVRKHLSQYETMDNFSKKNAIHINDTHPTLAIPELMRILMDECGYNWGHSMSIVKKTFSYTNHTIMPEALEQWSVELVRTVLPRIYSIIVEIDRRLEVELRSRYGDDEGKIAYMRIIDSSHVKMANLCVYVCHSVNGVSQIHSNIIKEQTFSDYYYFTPGKFKNVTNGIAYRRWLLQSAPELTEMISDLIGDGFKNDADELKKLEAFTGDAMVLNAVRDVKLKNKARLANYINKTESHPINPDTVFDVQAKRMHEYKRQHLNALHIVHRYLQVKNGRGADFTPHTYLFAAKAAPGYFYAKQMIRFICGLGKLLENDPDVMDLMRIVFLEDYRVTLSEILMPSADVSEQISTAGTEASGTGNMKLMLDGAVTIGTLDGANVEILDAVGEDNFVLFGMKVEEVNRLKWNGEYNPNHFYSNSEAIREVIDFISGGFNGSDYPEIANLRYHDPYFVLADFESYLNAQSRIDSLYANRAKWAGMSLMNTANAGRFSADRSVAEYAKQIWHISPVK